MSDGRKNNGGHSTKGFAGRKPKSDEEKLVRKLSPMEPEALKQLQKSIKNGDKWAVELFFKYMYGLPKQMIEAKHEVDGKGVPLMNWVSSGNDKSK